MTLQPLFAARELRKNYGEGPSAIEILKGVNLETRSGEMTAIVGASGSGKTTLLRILGTLDTPTSGELFFKGENLTQKKDAELAEYRNRAVGFIFQFHHLLPEFTALENVMMPGLIAGKKRAEMIEPATTLLAEVELSHRTHHKVGELSGGEQQRTALARALIMKPALLFADEPTGNLDSRSGDIVFELLQRLCSELALATVMVTHNMALADRMDRCLTLKDGVLLQE
ncbi:MAG: ABC transporter ATP-binding protein [Proteobacteria bacterium]|nr:ABC transporter ATP-binding protein [Pseudomonadota bacterium]MBU1649068.1 ABC transporter ATP-binding protein [Pseudomonadota bacterium]